MARIDLNIFSFDSRLDFQNGYVRESLHTKHSWHLKDLLEHINAKNFGYQEFGVDLDFIALRVNNVAVFGNIGLNDLLSYFGKILTLEPLSKKYVKKDLLIDYDTAFEPYREFFLKMEFIHPSEQTELKKYLPLNFIASSVNSEYYGDGFMLYIRWLLARHTLHKNRLLHEISKANGIFNHINTASLVFPADNCIDVSIEELQGEVLHLSEYKKALESLNNAYNIDFKGPKIKPKATYLKDIFINEFV